MNFLFVGLPKRSGGSENLFKEIGVSASLIAMYEWRKMSKAERAEALAERKLMHVPPHFGEGIDYYHISATCYEHASILNSNERLSVFELVDKPSSFTNST